MNLVKLVFIHLHDEQNSLGSWPQRASILDGERDKMSKWTKTKERKNVKSVLGRIKSIRLSLNENFCLDKEVWEAGFQWRVHFRWGMVDGRESAEDQKENVQKSWHGKNYGIMWK